MLQDNNNTLGEIDFLECEEESDENHDLISIQLLSTRIQVKYSQLCKYSKLIPNKYLICDIENSFSQDIQKFQQTSKIGDESINNFFKIFEDEQIIINNDKFDDFYKLSEFLQINPFIKKLKKYQILHQNDVDFIIMTFLKEISTKDESSDKKSELSIQTEQLLIKNINECLKNDKFKKFPVSLIFSLIDKSDKKQISSDLLFDFIKQSMEKHFVLLTFLDAYNLSDEKFQEFCEIFLNCDENITKYLQYLHFDIKYIKELKELQKKYNQIKEENQNLKDTLNQTNKEKQDLNDSFNQMKNENQNIKNTLNQTNKEKQDLNDSFNQIKEENQNLKEENNLLTKQIDKNNQNEIDTSNIFKGIIYYLQKNAVDSVENEIEVTSSSHYSSFEPKNAINYQIDSVFESNGEANPWLCIHFLRHKVIPKNYTIRSGWWETNNWHPRSWKIEGSLDNEKWETLDEQKDCPLLNGSNYIHTFNIKNKNNSEFQYLRIYMTGPNWYDTCRDMLVFDCIEFYGTLK